MTKTPADERALAALQAADTFRKIADQYLKRASRSSGPEPSPRQSDFC